MNTTPTPEQVQNLENYNTVLNESEQKKTDILTAYKALIEKAAEHGFTNEIDTDETGLPSNYLFCVDKWETARIIVPGDYYKHSNSTNLRVIIDRLSIWPYTGDAVSECKRTEFYRGTFDITDLDFFEKLLLSIFPKPVYPIPY